MALDLPERKVGSRSSEVLAMGGASVLPFPVVAAGPAHGRRRPAFLVQPRCRRVEGYGAAFVRMASPRFDRPSQKLRPDSLQRGERAH